MIEAMIRYFKGMDYFLLKISVKMEVLTKH